MCVKEEGGGAVKARSRLVVYRRYLQYDGSPPAVLYGVKFSVLWRIHTPTFFLASSAGSRWDPADPPEPPSPRPRTEGSNESDLGEPSAMLAGVVVVVVVVVIVKLAMVDLSSVLSMVGL